MPFSTIALFCRINIRKIKDDLSVQSKLSSTLENATYIFEVIATRDSESAWGPDERSKEGGQPISIFSLFLGKTVLNNTPAGF